MYALADPGGFCQGFETAAQPPLGCPQGEQLCDCMVPSYIASLGDCFRVPKSTRSTRGAWNGTLLHTRWGSPAQPPYPPPSLHRATPPVLRYCTAPLLSFSTSTSQSGKEKHRAWRRVPSLSCPPGTHAAAGQSGKCNREGLKSTWTTTQSRIRPGEDARGSYCCLQVPRGRVERGWSQTLPRGAWAQTEVQQGRAAAGALLTRRKFFPWGWCSPGTGPREVRALHPLKYINPSWTQP